MAMSKFQNDFITIPFVTSLTPNCSQNAQKIYLNDKNTLNDSYLDLMIDLGTFFRVKKTMVMSDLLNDYDNHPFCDVSDPKL